MTLNYVLYPILVQNTEKCIYLKVNIYFPCINTQRRATAPFDEIPVISPLQRKLWTTGIYQGSADCCEGYRESDLNCLASAILGNTLL